MNPDSDDYIKLVTIVLGAILVLVLGLLGGYVMGVTEGRNQNQECLEDEVAWWVDSYAGVYHYRSCVPFDDLVEEYAANQS